MEKILCVGFQKTGTSSIGSALRKLGYELAGWTNQTASLYKRGHIDSLLDMAEDFDAFEDLPWYLMYEQMYDKFPNSKLILTHRKNYDAWYASLANHVETRKMTAFSFLQTVYGKSNISDIKNHAINVHKNHVENVREFSRRNNIPLLEMCFENGDGWKELCQFLGRDEPKIAFPHTNKRPFIRTLKRKTKLVLGQILGGASQRA